MINKIIKIILSVSIAFTYLLVVNKESFVVKAAVEYNLYPMQCSSYEVSIVSDNGTFIKQACFNNFASAKEKMYSLGNDAVVRHYASYSPTKIIAMSSGVAVSYPMRSGSPTANIYQYINKQGKTTYVTKHREFAYFSTDQYGDVGDGMVHVNVTGFDGYIDLKNVDLVPTKLINNQIPLYLGGNDTTGLNEQPFNTRVYQGYFTVKNNGNYRDLIFIAHSGWSSNTWPAKYEIVVGPAADWMNTNAIYYSYNGYDFYSDQNYKNKVNTYYSYYLFLPLRSQSNIPADAYNNFLSSKSISGNSKLYNQGQTFINNQNSYGVNAALVFAMACLESAYGTSNFAMNRNNLFGWSAFDSNPNDAAYFSNINQAIYEHMSINLRGYLDINDTRFFGMHLGNKGSGLNVKYAADPYWGYKIAGIAYQLDKTANNYNGHLTDSNKYSLGLVNTYNVSVYKNNNVSSGELFKTAYGSTYQMNYIAPILSQEGNFVKIQSNNGIRNNGSLIYHKESNVIQPGEVYQWDKSVGFIENKYVTGINTLINTNIGKEPTGEFVFDVTSFEFNDQKLSINGKAYMPGIYVNDGNKVIQKLVIYDELYNETISNLNSSVSDNDVVSFSNENIDLSNLDYGNYFFSISTEYSTLPDNNKINYVQKIDGIPQEVKVDKKIYSFKIEDEYVFMTIKKDEEIIIPSEEPTPSPEQTPSPTPSLPPSTNVTIFRQAIEKFEYVDDTKSSISIKGLAFIKEMDASKDANIKHQLILTNMETNEKIVIDANTTSLDSPFNINDGYNYSKIVYEALIDLKEIPIGDYTIKISLTNDKTTKELFLTDTDLNNIPNITTIENKTYRFTQKQMYSYRYELSVYEKSIDYESINKPTRRDSLFGYETLNISDSLFNIKGVSWMYNVNYKNINHIKYNLLLLSSDGTINRYPLEVKKCVADYTSILNSKYDYNNTCFEGEVDLSILDDDTYLVYLENINGDYKDIIEIYDINSPEFKDIIDGNNTYSLKFNKTRFRLTLSKKIN